MRIYEINTRIHHRFDQITQDKLSHFSVMGFDAIWLMGVWQISEGAKKISRVVSEDFAGSPFAVPAYRFDPNLGGQAQFLSLVDRAHSAGLKVIVDFVSNHMALDSPWIEERPDFFIRSNPRLRSQSTADYFLHPSGEVVAYGRDPYFPPWHDTSQLDYTSEGLRRRMIDVLKGISQMADGVRCDMAMLVLRDHIRGLWYPNATASWFDERMPGEFWDQAISEVKKTRSDFAFIAEAYWDKESQLLDLGFDLAYEKRLYDGLVGRDAELVAARLMREHTDLSGSLCFIENHDEFRAATVFNNEENIAAAAMLLALPSSVLIHEGQIEGKREKLPVQRVRSLSSEPPDEQLREDYLKLLHVTKAEVFIRGSFHLFNCGSPGVIGFFRQDRSRTVIYLGQIGPAYTDFGVQPLDLTTVSQAVQAAGRVNVLDLMGSRSIELKQHNGRFVFHPQHLIGNRKRLFCLLQLSPV